MKEEEAWEDEEVDVRAQHENHTEGTEHEEG